LEGAKAALRKQQESLLHARAEIEKERAILAQSKQAMQQTAVPESDRSSERKELLALKRQVRVHSISRFQSNG